MTIDHGNRGARVAGTRYDPTDPLDDIAAYDKLPKRLRAVLRTAPARFSAIECLERLRAGHSEARVLNSIELGIKGFLENANRERGLQ